MSTNIKSTRKKLSIAADMPSDIVTQVITEQVAEQIIKNNEAPPSAAVIEQKESTTSIIYLSEIKRKSTEELLKMAEEFKIEDPESMYRQDLVFAILQKVAEQGWTMIGEGVLEVLSDGFGFLRSHQSNYMPGPDDIYVSPNQIRKNALRTGDTISGTVREPKKGERYFALTTINTINKIDFHKQRHRVYFDDLTALFPHSPLTLENLVNGTQANNSARIIDMLVPLGRGQRALVVAPPRTGKTILMQSIAHSITTNHPDIILIVLMIGERPEEVTDMVRSVKGEVVSSTFDEPSSRHVQLAEMVIEKAKRLVEDKKHVVILLDSITRLARAYNDISPSSGKVLSGGVDSNALQKPKRFFGAARNTEEGGSLTIIGTALVETGSRMDEVIFEEFKGTGNSEIVLDRKLSERRIFPAIDISKSGTRKEDLLISKTQLAKTWILRRVLTGMSTAEAVEFLTDKMKFSKSNEEFFAQMDTNTKKS
jgi:transcription termination factor Rho